MIGGDRKWLAEGQTDANDPITDLATTDEAVHVNRQFTRRIDGPMTEREEVPWEGQCADAAYEFALRCADFASRNPHNLAAPLNGIITSLMTELWDRNFSQTEIRTAFEEAIKDMPRYAAGEERRSSISTELATADWLGAGSVPDA